jgi:HK97 family phage prohead protease
MNNKVNSSYKIKSHSLEVKDVDTSTRRVAMYLSAFNNIDSDDDVIRKGAFAKSLQERGVDSPSNRKIAFLRHHDWKWQIGKFVELKEDNYGLYAVGELGTSTLGDDALKDYQEGVIREHSIGFRYIADKIKFVEDKSMANGGFYDISEVALWEGSAVTFGANEMTPVLEVGKSLESKDKIISDIMKDLNTIVKALSVNNRSDESYYNLEMQHKFLTSQLAEIAGMAIKTNDVKQNIKEDVSEVLKSFDWNAVLTNLK